MQRSPTATRKARIPWGGVSPRGHGLSEIVSKRALPDFRAKFSASLNGSENAGRKWVSCPNRPNFRALDTVHEHSVGNPIY